MVTSDPLACVAPLFVPGDRPERFEKAAASGADAILIDLEDAVAPSAKAQARDGLRHLPQLQVPVFVRVNAAQTEWYTQDIEAVRSLPIAGVVLPKAEAVEAITALSGQLGNGKGIVALVETAEGLAQVRQIARAANQLRLAFGSIDFCADLGCAHTREALLCARMELVLASRLANLPPPLDGVTTETSNFDVVESDARYAAGLGFAGKLCIHPRQIEPTYAGFSPTQDELEWARDILAAGSEGAVAVNGQMIDAPVRRRAEALLARGKRRSGHR
jgi:citrate lyase subunit beta/citryl-CoA lyase